MSQSFYRVSSHPILTEQTAIYTTREISRGEILFDLSNSPKITTNNRYAITIDSQTYIDTIGSDGKYINHSCDPNVFFDKTSLRFIAKMNIAKDEMITYDYSTTELPNQMVEPFKCLCGSSKCRVYIG